MNILITGCGRGIGFEFTKQFLEKGNTVFGLSRTVNRAPLLELQKKYPEKLKLFQVDVTNDLAVKKAAEEVGKSTTIDLLVNNAGIFQAGEDDGDFETLDLSAVEKTIEVNTISPMRVTQNFLENLKKSKQATLINITSLMGSIADNGSGGYYAYRMSKAALNMFNKSFSKDHTEITSVVLHPGWVRTEMGGSQAPTLPDESVRGMIAVIEKLKTKDSGKFFDFEGDELPW